VYVLAAFEVVHAFLYETHLPLFSESYWYVNYRYGFIRRGLVGQALSLVFGRNPSTAVVSVVAAGISVVAITSIFLTVVLLLRRRTARSAALALLIVSSPFSISYLVIQRRPDELAIPVMVGLGIGLLRLSGRLRSAFCGLIGLLFGALVLVHEGILLYYLPWALAMIALVLSRQAKRAGTFPSREIVRLMSMVLGPTALATAGVFLFGTPSTTVVNRLKGDALAGPLRSQATIIRNGEPTMFGFLGNSLHDSVRLVLHIPISFAIGSVLLGTALFVLHGLWLRNWSDHRIFDARVVPSRILSFCRGAVIVGALITFAIGIDWMRWFAAIGCGWLIASAFGLLADEGDAGAPSTARVPLPRLLPILAIYLAVLPPLYTFEPLRVAFDTVFIKG
jgi:hypothetical protein